MYLSKSYLLFATLLTILTVSYNEEVYIEPANYFEPTPNKPFSIKCSYITWTKTYCIAFGLMFYSFITHHKWYNTTYHPNLQFPNPILNHSYSKVCIYESYYFRTSFDFAKLTHYLRAKFCFRGFMLKFKLLDLSICYNRLFFKAHTETANERSNGEYLCYCYRSFIDGDQNTVN